MACVQLLEAEEEQVRGENGVWYLSRPDGVRVIRISCGILIAA